MIIKVTEQINNCLFSEYIFSQFVQSKSDGSGALSMLITLPLKIISLPPPRKNCLIFDCICLRMLTLAIPQFYSNNSRIYWLLNSIRQQVVEILCLKVESLRNFFRKSTSSSQVCFSLIFASLYGLISLTKFFVYFPLGFIK